MKKLRLSKEVLADLDLNELRSVAGATHLCATAPCTHVTCLDCFTLDPFNCALTSPIRCLTATCT